TGIELVDGDGFDHASLTVHQVLDTRQGLSDALAKPSNLGVVSNVAVRRRLPRPDKGVVLASQRLDVRVRFLQGRLRCCQPLLILSFQTPCERATEVGYALPKSA